MADCHCIDEKAMDLQVNIKDKYMMAMLFAEDWESLMQEFKAQPMR